ncbi:MAG: glycine cleavage system protein GcvH [Armatimonadetes bacterium]|nr:glycine cleavage system protein GcvH [Armatimonadota bacterium]
MYPSDIKYTETHEWARPEDGTITIGITYHAVNELGDIVTVDLPRVGATVVAGEPLGSVDSVKAASDVISPVTGEVVEVNDSLLDAPELMNQEPYGSGWMVKVRMDDPSEIDSLLTSDEYQQRL